MREPLPDGLGAEIRTLKHLCQDDPGALDAIDRATVGGRGGDRRSEAIKHNNVMNDPVEKSAQGSSNTYALRKLRKDRPDLWERVLSEEISRSCPLQPAR